MLLSITLVTLVSLVTMLASSIASSIYGAPFVPIKKKIVGGLLAFGGLEKGDNFYDLGSGDGRVLLAAVGDFGVKKATGYEVTTWPYLESKFSIWQSGAGNIDVRRENFFKADLSDATFIYLYLFPKLVNELAAKISAETKPGTKILCPSFPIDVSRYPDFRLIKTQDFGRITAYLFEKI